VKTAGFAALARLLSLTFADASAFWQPTLAGVALLTLLVGNLLAARQASFKRMMAYSSISHAGYLLIALVGFSAESASAILFYSFSYSLATVAAFAVLLVVSQRASKSQALAASSSPTPIAPVQADHYEQFNGLARTNPLLAFAMTVAMCSLAGIPLTAGFFGKFFIFLPAANQWPWLLVAAVLMSTVGIYYYFRVVIAMYMRAADQRPAIVLDAGTRIVLWLSTGLTLLLGLAPNLFKAIF
jgi:NADH-quinone oxidoreductase subunit N